MYASTDVNIVMMIFFELFLLRKISEFASDVHRNTTVQIAQWLDRLTGDLKIVGSSPAREIRYFSASS